MIKPKPPCLHCRDRERICKEFGTCHNKHCPNGWTDYYGSKKLYQKIVKESKDAGKLQGRRERFVRPEGGTHETLKRLHK